MRAAASAASAAVSAALSAVPTLVAALIFASSLGCASPHKVERQVHEARMRAASAEQRAVELDARLRAIETSMVFQQSMLGRTMAKQDATDRAIAALPHGLADGLAQPAQQGEQRAASTPPVPPKELIDLSGQAVVGADDATVRDILTQVEAYMGRKLTASERIALGQVLRRPRVIDTTNPWGPGIFHDR